MVAPWTEIEVRAKRLRIDGTPAEGTIRIKPYPRALTHVPSNTVVIPAYGLEKTLDRLGEMTIFLPATDDPDFDIEAGTWNYKVIEEIDGKPIEYSIELPVSLENEGLDLTVVLGEALPGTPISLVTRAEFDSLKTRVDDLEELIEGLI